MQRLMTAVIEARAPGLGATDGQEAPTVCAHFLSCLNGWCWWMTEYDPEPREAFGLAQGFADEWGYFSIAEMEELNRSKGFNVIDREGYFKSKPVSECRRQRPRRRTRTKRASPSSQNLPDGEACCNLLGA